MPVPTDPAKQIRWIEKQNRAEIFQIAHRIRFLLHSGKLLIIEGHAWPEDFGPPDTVIDLTRKASWKEETRRRALEVFDYYGWLDRILAALNGFFVKGDEASVAKVLTDFEAIEIGYPTLIRKKGVYIDKSRVASPIILPKVDDFRDLLLWVAEQRGVPLFKTKLFHWGRNWCLSVGDIEKARADYGSIHEATGGEFSPELPGADPDDFRIYVPRVSRAPGAAASAT